MKRTEITDRLIVVGLLAWAATDVPWWWRPPGHSAPTPVVLGFILLMLTQSVPFFWWRRWPLLAAALAAAVLAIRIAARPESLLGGRGDPGRAPSAWAPGVTGGCARPRGS